jgi:secondary thiamine-phosphate synthase enzyme
MIHQHRFGVRTQGHGDMHDISSEVEAAVRDSGIQTGTAHVFVVGSTAAVGTIEYEPGLRGDLPRLLDRIVPPSREYGHERAWHDGNGHSHLQASWLGPSITVAVSGGEPALGTWQQVFLLECDVRSRDREVLVTVSGE